MQYFTGNRAALSACGNIARAVELKEYDDIEPQLEMIEEEVVQLREFINNHFPENKLPTALRRR